MIGLNSPAGFLFGLGLVMILFIIGQHAPFLSAAGSAELEAGSSTDPPLEIESRSVVFSYPQTDPYDLTNLYGFNHAPSVTRMPDGRLLCTWFSGPFEASVHQVLLASFSYNEGRTWEKAFVIQDQPRSSDFDPAFIRDGRRVYLFYVYGRWNRYPFMRGESGEKEYIGPDSYHLYARHTDDSGDSWSKEVLVDPTAGSRSNGIRLTSGELLLPIHDFLNRQESTVLKSTDGGRTWRRGGNIRNEAGVGEPTMAELPNGRILMALRTRDSYLWTTVSNDRGESWSRPHRHEMLAATASHNLFRISDGRVVLTHDECEAGLRSPLTMRITRDGESWSDSLIIAESRTPGAGNDYWGSQVTYPSVVEVSDKTLVIVWARINLSNREQYGEIRSARVKILN